MERKIKAKRLFNRVSRIKSMLDDLDFEARKGINPQLDFQDIETKRDLWCAIDKLRSFLDNLE